MIGAAELLFLAAFIGLLYRLLRPVRRRLEKWIAQRLPHRGKGRRAQVVVLERRRDGTFGPEGRDGG